MPFIKTCVVCCIQHHLELMWGLAKLKHEFDQERKASNKSSLLLYI